MAYEESEQDSPSEQAVPFATEGMGTRISAVADLYPSRKQAAQAAGASPLQVIAHGVLPQVFTQFADVTMYRWEYNFRQSTVMGMVGAGGIGTELVGSLRILDYQQVSAILIMILAAVTVVDWLSSVLRERFK